jgi:predicted ATPase/class 3 adenylate cyclase
MSETRAASSSLPTGIVTFLFTDIEGSTKLVHELGDGYPEVLNLHHELLRAAFSRHGGVEVVTTGDGFFVAFPEAKGALAASIEGQSALAAQHWLHEATVRVRMGLHTGEAMVVDDDYVGLDVHRAARIMSAAHGGQVVMSETTANLLDAVTSTKDLGIHRLKDLDRPEHILQALIPGLPADFPPLRSLTPPTNIPRSPDPIVGRLPEIEELRRLLISPDHRLITITGTGGTGKTQLASNVAAGLLDGFVDGSIFVDLSGITSEAGVAMSIADALSFGADRDGMGTDLVTEIGNKHLLLVLDNFEQVISAADLVCDLVQRCPNLCVLVTSQVVLRVRGEWEFPLTPLGLPEDVSVESVVGSDAAQLFVRRAAAVRPDFEITPRNAGAIAQICRLLDGLPLALELAAARTKVLSPEDLVGRLDDRLKLLTGGARDAPTRHQTLRATLDWSYGLLSPHDQSFLRDFSVFSGGASLEAIEHVLETEGEHLDRVASMVEHSLIRRADSDEVARFSMLQSIRTYALELLDGDPARDRVRERHAGYYLRLATADADDRDHGLDVDLENFRGALEWWLERGGSGDEDAANDALQLASALGRFWYTHGHSVEGIQWFERALALAEDPPAELRAKATRHLGILVETTRDLERAGRLFEEALQLYRTAGSQSGEAASLNSLGVTRRSLGDLDAAEEFLERAIALRRDLGDEPGLSSATSNLGITAVDRGDLDRAQKLFEESLAIDHKLNDQWGVTVGATNLAIVHLERGDYTEAARLAAEALSGFSENGDLDGVAESLEISAAIAGATGDPRGAARLAAAADALRTTAGLPLAPPDRTRLDRWLAGPRAETSEKEFKQSWDEGAAMTLQQVTDHALRRAGKPRSEPPASSVT